jgi:addiction module RelE/StbE family toxin
MKVSFSPSFRRAFKKAIRKRPDLEKKFYERTAIFAENPFDERLRTHKLSGLLKDYWSFTIEYDARVVFYFVESDKAEFVDIGKHDEVY